MSAVQCGTRVVTHREFYLDTGPGQTGAAVAEMQKLIAIARQQWQSDHDGASPDSDDWLRFRCNEDDDEIIGWYELSGDAP